MNRTHLVHRCDLASVPLHSISGFRAPTHDVLCVAILLAWKLASKRQKRKLHPKWPPVIATIFNWLDQSQSHSDSVCAGGMRHIILENGGVATSYSRRVCGMGGTVMAVFGNTIHVLLPFCSPATLALFLYHTYTMFLLRPRFRIFANTVTSV